MPSHWEHPTGPEAERLRQLLQLTPDLLFHSLSFTYHGRWRVILGREASHWPIASNGAKVGCMTGIAEHEDMLEARRLAEASLQREEDERLAQVEENILKKATSRKQVETANDDVLRMLGL